MNEIREKSWQLSKHKFLKRKIKTYPFKTKPPDTEDIFIQSLQNHYLFYYIMSWRYLGTDSHRIHNLRTSFESVLSWTDSFLFVFSLPFK